MDWTTLPYRLSPAFEPLYAYMEDIRRMTSASAAAVYVIQDGIVAAEWYAGLHGGEPGSRRIDAASQFHVASVRKTYLGLAVGMALHEGLIRSIDDPAADYLDNPNRELLAGTTIRHMATHTHGVDRTNQRIFAPGTDWNYNNYGVHKLFQVVGNVFGKPLAEVMQERVFEPYGFMETGWRKERDEHLVWMDESYTSDNGREANLFVSTRELARWGYLHLTEGELGGKRHVPREAFAFASRVWTPSGLAEGLPRNGLFWQVQDKPRLLSEIGPNVPAGAFQSLGFFGNAVLVIPQTRTVAVRMLNESGQQAPGYRYLEDIRTFGDQAAACAEAYRRG